MPTQSYLAIGPWLPDTPAISRDPNGASTEALNVVARAESYGPFPSFLPFATTALPADEHVRGAFSVRRNDNTAVVIVGTRDKLYKITGHSVVDVSRTMGGPYSCPEDSFFWTFCQFGENVLAFNGFDTPQTVNIDTGTNFADLGGSPPRAIYCAVVGDFVMAAHTTANNKLVKWSAINNSADWVPSQLTQSDEQTLPDGGNIVGLVGIEYAATIFQEFSIRRAIYEGPPDIFRFSLLTPSLGCAIPGSINKHMNLIFFCDRSGFFMIQGLGAPVPIGEQRVNRWFWSNVDGGNLSRISSAVDVTNSNYVISFPDTTSLDGTPNHQLLYCWPLDRWTHAQPGDIEYIWPAAPSGGWTIEDVAAVYPTVEIMPHAWDSAFWLGVPQRFVAGFDSSHRMGYFNGMPLAATIDTTEANIIPGRKAFVRSIRPMLDAIGDGSTNGPLCGVSLMTRDRLNDTVNISAPVAQDKLGLCKFRSKARYHRARALIPASANWSHFIGVDDITAHDAGVR
jgi:hypothetical protein